MAETLQEPEGSKEEFTNNYAEDYKQQHPDAVTDVAQAETEAYAMKPHVEDAMKIEAMAEQGAEADSPQAMQQALDSAAADKRELGERAANEAGELNNQIEDARARLDNLMPETPETPEVAKSNETAGEFEATTEQKAAAFDAMVKALGEHNEAGQPKKPEEKVDSLMAILMRMMEEIKNQQAEAKEAEERERAEKAEQTASTETAPSQEADEAANAADDEQTKAEANEAYVAEHPDAVTDVAQAEEEAYAMKPHMDDAVSLGGMARGSREAAKPYVEGTMSNQNGLGEAHEAAAGSLDAAAEAKVQQAERAASEVPKNPSTT
jgi:hypothetical protein